MTDAVGESLLIDLQQVSEVVQSLHGCLEPEEIARRTTEGLVQKFGCAFARIWLVEPDRAALRLVSSSGLYTRIDGSFARVPMGAFKVGKIAQNRIPFLSNHLAEETWVRDRDWAIANKIVGFAGYPLALGDRVVGVVAVFSYTALSPEFLEVLQTLCTTVTILLETAIQYQREKQAWQSTTPVPTLPLSEQLAGLLAQTRVILVGPEQPLPGSLTCALLQAAELLQKLTCLYCRLTYQVEHVTLEATLSTASGSGGVAAMMENLRLVVMGLGGELQIGMGTNQDRMQVSLRLPYRIHAAQLYVRIRLQWPALQIAFTGLARQAGLGIWSLADMAVPLLTDDLAQIQPGDRVLWLAQPAQSVPANIWGQLDLSATPDQLKQAVTALSRGETWNLSSPLEETASLLSEREGEIMALLAQGLRDREIAAQLHISDRTVKFHLTNILTKLKADTRCQAMYLAACKGWLAHLSK